jgi:hypothetical protein
MLSAVACTFQVGAFVAMMLLLNTLEGMVKSLADIGKIAMGAQLQITV